MFSVQVFKNMEEINHMNWQFFILQENLSENAINDMESMMVNRAFNIIKEDAKASKLLTLISIGMDVNLYSSVASKTGQKWVKFLKKAPSNNREDRARP